MSERGAPKDLHISPLFGNGSTSRLHAWRIRGKRAHHELLEPIPKTPSQEKAASRQGAPTNPSILRVPSGSNPERLFFIWNEESRDSAPPRLAPLARGRSGCRGKQSRQKGDSELSYTEGLEQTNAMGNGQNERDPPLESLRDVGMLSA